MPPLSPGFSGERFFEEVKSLILQKSGAIALKNNRNSSPAQEDIRGAEYRKNAAVNDFLPKLSVPFQAQATASIYVLDAPTLLNQAQTNYINTLGDYNIAKARLGKAIGEY